MRKRIKKMAHGMTDKKAINGAVNPVSSVILSINQEITPPINVIIKLVYNNGSINHQSSIAISFQDCITTFSNKKKRGHVSDL